MTDGPRMTAHAFRVFASIMRSSERELSGAQLIKQTGLATGTLYPLLLRFEAAGWLKARREKEDPSKLGRPRRRYYSVTAKGAAHAREYQTELSQFDGIFAPAKKA